MTSPRILVNCITDANSKVLVKTWFIGDDGPEKKGGGQLVSGEIKTLHLTLAEYIRMAVDAGPDQFFVTSNKEYSDGTAVMSRSAVGSYAAHVGGDAMMDVITRTKDELVYEHDKPGIFVSDHDYNDRCTTGFDEPEDLAGIYTNLFPEVFKANIAHGSYYSSSSYIYNGEEQITGAKGFHLVHPVKDAGDIPRFRDALFGHLWLKGYGYLAIAKDGRTMSRTIFDKIAVQSQQPIFTQVNCNDGLEQRRPEPVIVDGEYLDTTALPSLTTDEQMQVDALIDQAKEKAKEEREDIRRNYVKAEAQRLVDNADGSLTIRRAKRIVESRIGGTLIGSDILFFDAEGPITVAKVLTNASSWNRKTLADPLEPDYGGGRGKAIFYANENSGQPLVFSQAHWGRVFLLKFDLASAKQMLVSMSEDEARDTWTDIAVMADLRDDEEEAFIEAVKEHIGGTKPILIRTYKKALNQHMEQIHGSRFDPADMIADRLLRNEYNKGRHLMQTDDKSFWRYVGTHWERVKDVVLLGELQRTAKSSWHAVTRMNCGTAPRMSDIVSQALIVMGRRVVRDGDPLHLMSPAPAVINCANGELWLQKDGPVLHPHKPGSFLTSCSGIVYNSEAEAPTYDHLVRALFCYPGGAPMPDQSMIVMHVEEMLGYSIQPARFLKTFYLFVGDGDNGKTQLVKLFSRIIGMNAAVWTRLDGIEEDKFRAVDLIGKKAAIDDDADKNFLLPDGFLKRIAEEKPMSGQYKFKDTINFIAAVVPFILANHFPRSRDLSRGMRTRLEVVKFPRSFLKPGEKDEDGKTVDASHIDVQKPELWKQVHADELSGVLNRFIVGFYRVQERGAFETPPSCEAAADEWLREANPVSRFLHEVLVPGEQGDRILLSDLYRVYADQWAMEERISMRYVAERNTFKRHLESCGCRVKRTEKGMALYGYKDGGQYRIPIMGQQRTVVQFPAAEADR